MYVTKICTRGTLYVAIHTLNKKIQAKTTRADRGFEVRGGANGLEDFENRGVGGIV